MEPFILVIGEAGEENTQYFVYSEVTRLVESASLRDTFVDIIAACYCFNISYPNCSMGLYLFFQQYVFSVKDSQVPPLCLAKLLKNFKSCEQQ